jgi:uncharacterized membrane protein
VQTKPWTPRQTSGSVLAAIGVCALLLKNQAMGLVGGKPLFVVGLVQVILAIVGPVFLVVGLYRIGTKDKTPSRSESRRNWAILAVGVAAIGLYAWTTIPNRAPLPGPQAESAPRDKWVEIDSNGRGDSLHIHLASIRRAGNLVEYWTKLQFAVPRNIGNARVSNLLDKFVADCANKTLAHKISQGLTETGQSINFLFASPLEQSFAPLPDDPKHPNSIFFRRVCST